ncbi:hypothetical protein H5410_030622 [Solanum commersonii]|uniref:Uncharacterized protein n=1 Tax=Solanum commersonii TaxID=4109 RepID=A0A9J5YJ87_SOLCO|nr:hypothetical protein H5410_030622 [Solanum commersonii]
MAILLIDNGSKFNIFPLSTLTQLNYDVRKFHESCMNIRTFNGTKRDYGGSRLDHEIVIHGKGSDRSYPGFSILVIEESSQGIDFHMVEIMNVAFNDTTPQVQMPPEYKILAMTMLRSEEELFEADTRKKHDWDIPKPIPELYQSYFA